MLYARILLISHAVGCAAFLWLHIAKRIPIRLAALPMVLLIPVFGPLCGLLLGIHRFLYQGTAPAEVPEWGTESASEESLILNSYGDQRNAMTDLLTGDPEAFRALREQAVKEQDTKTVRRADTAMAEVNRQYELRLQTLGEQYRRSPEAPGVPEQYCRCLEQYLSLGLVSGHAEQVRRREYIALLRVMISRTPEEACFSNLARQLMLVGDFRSADVVLQEIAVRWPASETVWLLRLEYHARRHDGKALAQTLQAASASGISFSANARDQLRFWAGNGRGL